VEVQKAAEGLVYVVSERLEIELVEF